MPYIAQGELGSSGKTDFSRMNHDYKYPKDWNLKPGTELHKEIVDKVMQRARLSATHMSNRFSSWQEIDRTLTTYIDLTDSENELVAEDSKKPVSIVFPHSYAILETIMGYLLAAFYQDPVFMYEGVSPEDTIGAIMLEKVIDHQVTQAKMILNLHTMFRDSLSYGFGVVAPTWTIKKGLQYVKQVTERIFLPPKLSKRLVDAVLYEGNMLINIDPYLCLPDPNFSITEVQKSEFFGWVDKTNYPELMVDEKNSDDLFNVKYLDAVANKRTSIYNDDSNRNTKSRMEGIADNTYTKPVDTVQMYLKIIPAEWKLGKGEYPEIYKFRVAADEILISCQPLGLTHNMFPIAVAAPDYDGYSITPVSRLEVLYGMQNTLDWLFNSHIANVRKAINNTIVYDPYLLNTDDFKKLTAGGLVRLRRVAWGRGVKDTYGQLNVTDVTRGHVVDAENIVGIMDKTAGVDASTMGALRSGGPERLTGKEFAGTQSGAFTRLERIARIIGVQAMQDIAYMFAHHTQQLMSQETYLNISGRWQETLMNEFQAGNTHGWNGGVGQQGKFKATPFDILVNYDVKTRDGSIPGSNFSQVWIQMFEVLANHQELLQQFDLTKIFMHIARNSGAKNAESFLRVKTMDDTQAEQQAQQGNLVNLAEAMGGLSG